MKIGIVILSLVATINSVLIKNRLYSLYSNNADRLRFNETKEIRFKEKISNNEVYRQLFERQDGICPG